MTRVRTYDISAEDMDVSVTIETEGDAESVVEKVHLHAHDQAVRALQALRDDTTPEEADGIGISIDWDHRPDDEDPEPTFTCRHCGQGFYAEDYNTGESGAQAALAGHSKTHYGEDE